MNKSSKMTLKCLPKDDLILKTLKLQDKLEEALTKLAEVEAERERLQTELDDVYKNRMNEALALADSKDEIKQLREALEGAYMDYSKAYAIANEMMADEGDRLLQRLIKSVDGTDWGTIRDRIADGIMIAAGKERAKDD